MNELKICSTMDEVANVVMSEVDEKTEFFVKRIVLERKDKSKISGTFE